MFRKIAYRACAMTLVLAGAMALGGCSHSTGFLTFNSVDSQRIYFQDFNIAYISDGRDGEYDVVLLNDEMRAAKPQLTRAPLQPIERAALRQVLRLHIFWKAPAGNAAKESSVTNASIDWCLFGNGDLRQGEMMRYEGAGYVRLDSKTGAAEIYIRDGRVKPTMVKGQLKDPIGASAIHGNIRAIANDSRVKEIIRAMELQIAGKDENAAFIVAGQ